MEHLPHHHQPKRSDYVGDSDQDVLAFINNLARCVQAQGPEAFGLTADDQALIIARRDAYAAAYSLANANSTKTQTAVLRKNESRDEADRVSRMYAQIIKRLPGVSDTLKIIAGAPVEKPGRTPKGQPRTFPWLHVDTALKPTLASEVKVRFYDAALSTGRMPREDGVTHLILHAEIAPEAKYTMKESSMRAEAYLTRNPYTMRFDSKLFERFGLREGDRDYQFVGVMLRGQWLNAKGEVGPLGPPAMFNVPVKFGAVKKTDEPALLQAA